MARNGSINLPSNATSPLNLLASKYFAYIDFGPFDWVHANAAGHTEPIINPGFFITVGEGEEGGMWKGGGIKWTNVPLIKK